MSLIATVGPSGGVKNRLNIVDFVKKEKFFTLYVRALQTMQERAQNGDWESFFQIGGIHGLPYTEWARKYPNPHPVQAEYCTHAQVLFPTWHRSYISLYEQILQEAAIEIAKKFTVKEKEKEEWKQAAQDLRQPYWDWASEMVPPREVIADENVEIIDYDGTKIRTQNPLFCYHFNPIDPSFKGLPVENWDTTRRYPDLNGKTDVNGLIERLQDEQELGSIRSSTLRMLNNVDNWELFSNHGVWNDPKSVKAHENSLEANHDQIHGMIGVGHVIPDGRKRRMRGHMTIVEVAGFDPIFYLHHTNVDRLLSLWYALHDTWVSPGISRGATMGIPAGPVDKNTQLEPFYKDMDTPWTSVPLTDTGTFGYSYPEFDGLIGGPPDLIRDAVSERVNKLYGIPLSPETSSNKALYLLSNFQGLTQDHEEPLRMYDWTIHASFKKFELKHSFAILFYFAKDGGSPYKNRSYVGSVTSFHRDDVDNCANCKNNIDIVQEGFVHLNYILAKNIRSFDPKTVRNYLKNEQLTYEFMLAGEDAPLTSLKVTVEGHPLVIQPGEKYSKADKSQPNIVYDDVIVHPST